MPDSGVPTLLYAKSDARTLRSLVFHCLDFHCLDWFFLHLVGSVLSDATSEAKHSCSLEMYNFIPRVKKKTIRLPNICVCIYIGILAALKNMAFIELEGGHLSEAS